VHAHIIPRKRNDLPEDEIYRMLESRDADIARAHDQLSGTQTPSTMLMEGAYLSKGEDKEGHAQDLRLALNRATGGKFPVVKPDAERVPRSEEEMKEEAQWLAAKLAELGIA
jgi:bis(5'-adenosyl)-triphosphatase